MTDERNIEKNLAGAQDLDYGEGISQQTRNGGAYDITQVRGFWPVNSQEEFDAIDPVRFPKVATVFNVDGELALTFYAYAGGSWVELGSTGAGSSGVVFKAIMFQRSDTMPATPTGGSYDSPVPPGWSDGIPEGAAILWGTTRIFTSNGSAPQQDAWTTPTQMTDTETIDYEWSSVAIPGNPTDNPDNWSNTPTVNTIWQASRPITNGVYGSWTIIRIRGEDGTPANDSYKSTVFVRSDSQPDIPTGGSYTNPVPAGWYDGIPPGSAILWGSSRILSRSGAAPQQVAWSTPAQMTDTETLDYEWSSAVTPGTPSTHPELWSNTPSVDTIWQAMRTITNGVYGSWTVIRIRGEDGQDGDGARYGGWYNISNATGTWDDATAASACPNGTPVEDDVVTIWKLTDDSVASTKRYNGTAWVTPSVVLHGDVLTQGTVRGDRLVAGTEIVSPLITGGTIDGGIWQSIGPNVMIVMSGTPFGPDGLIEWKGPRIVDAGGSPVLASLTKANALMWTDENADGYFGGTLSVGVLRSAYSNTTKAEYNVGEAIVEIGPFNTNGDTKSIVLSYNLRGSSFATSGSCPANPATATLSWRLERKIGGGAWTSVLTGAWTGSFYCTQEGTDVLSTEQNGGSTTYTDTTGTVDDFSYRVVCTAYDRYMVTSNIDSQSFSLSSTEA